MKFRDLPIDSTPSPGDTLLGTDSADGHSKQTPISAIISIAQTTFDGRYSLLAHVHTFASLTGKPTTLAGYGIADGVLTSDARLSDARVPLAHTQAWSTIMSTPTALAGYGIADAAPLAHVSDTANPHAVTAAQVGALTQAAGDGRYSLLGHAHTFASLTSKPTSLAGYGISDAYTQAASDGRFAPLVAAALTNIADYTLTTTDDAVFADATSGSLTLTLPTAVGVNGRIYTLKRLDGSLNLVTVAAQAGEFIDGDASVVLDYQYEYLILQSNGTGWQIIGD